MKRFNHTEAKQNFATQSDVPVEITDPKSLFSPFRELYYPNTEIKGLLKRT